MTRSSATLRRWVGLAVSPAAAPLRRRRSVVLALAVAAAGTAALGPATPVAAQFSATPVILEMVTAEGSAAGVITVRHEGSETLSMRVYVGDYDQPLDGGHTFFPAGEHARSCADRLQFLPERFELEPGRTQDVRLRMAAGEGTCWSLVFVQTAPPGSTGIGVTQRIGVKVYGVRPDAPVEGEVRAVSLEPAPDHGGMLLRVDFENLGEAPLRPEGEMEVRTPDGNVVGVAAIPAFSVLPGHVRRAEVLVTLDLPPGEYLGIPILDFGGEYLAGGQAAFSIPEG